ncbi:MAG: fused MFS/spermidine synthase [Planctomycetota bacterium]|nr:fused MFS/spermidine synthase [Planctomycetota bacterium]
MTTAGAHAGRLAIAGVSGFLVLSLEFAAVRLFAPAFGQSTYVWSTVIALVLAALAAGYAFGGRLGDRATSLRPLSLAHLGAALWTVIVLAGGPSLVAALVPAGLPEAGGLPMAFVAGLIATLVLFVPPAFLLGMTSPYLIRFDARAGHTGEAAGSIYAFGTVGSLIACYATPIILLQDLGTSGTFLLCAVLAAAMGGLGLLLSRPSPGGSGAEDRALSQPEGPVLRRWLVVALVVGLGVTVVEFAAVRFMAPWFGQSNHVWAHVIGVLMLALALGSWLGGRYADRPGSLGALWVVLNTSAFWIYIAAGLAPLLLEWLAPTTLTSVTVLGAARWGSLAATAILFGVPFLLLGMTTPFLVRKASENASVGKSAGAVLAWGTVGGIAGCLLTPTVLVPALGSRGTLLIAGAAIVAVAGWGIHRERKWGFDSGMVPAAGLLACVFAIWFFHGTPLRSHEGQITEIESRYQTVRVVERNDGLLLPTPRPAWGAPTGKIPVRFLRHDEDAETFQSSYLLVPTDRVVPTLSADTNAFVRQPLPAAPAGDPLTGGQYFEHMALGAHYVRYDEDKPIRVLIIGYAGGTVHSVLHRTKPRNTKLDVLGIEIDPAVIDVADEYLGHKALRAVYDDEKAGRLRLVTGEDARTVINALPEDDRFELILVDAYARTNYIPFQLATREFFDKLEAHLAPGGWIGVNVLGDGTKSPVAKSVAMTMTDAVGATYIVPNPSYPGNVLLWTSADVKHAPRVGSPGLAQLLMRRAAYATERVLVRYDPKAETDERVVVLTDDKAPSDKLADEELGI